MVEYWRQQMAKKQGVDFSVAFVEYSKHYIQFIEYSLTLTQK